MYSGLLNSSPGDWLADNLSSLNKFRWKGKKAAGPASGVVALWGRYWWIRTAGSPGKYPGCRLCIPRRYCLPVSWAAFGRIMPISSDFILSSYSDFEKYGNPRTFEMSSESNQLIASGSFPFCIFFQSAQSINHRRWTCKRAWKYFRSGSSCPVWWIIWTYRRPGPWLVDLRQALDHDRWQSLGIWQDHTEQPYERFQSRSWYLPWMWQTHSSASLDIQRWWL